MNSPPQSYLIYILGPEGYVGLEGYSANIRGTRDLYLIFYTRDNR